MELCDLALSKCAQAIRQADGYIINMDREIQHMDKIIKKQDEVIAQKDKRIDSLESYRDYAPYIILGAILSGMIIQNKLLD